MIACSGYDGRPPRGHHGDHEAEALTWNGEADLERGLRFSGTEASEKWGWRAGIAQEAEKVRRDDRDARQACDLLHRKKREAFVRRAQIPRPPEEGGSG